MTSIVVRTLILYVILNFTLRIMGKRQLGELDVAELVPTLLISQIASIPIDDPDIPLLNAIIPILFILSLEIIISTIKNKSEKIKNLIEGRPEYVIYKGRLLQKALRDNRISVNELLSQIRAQGVGDINEIYYASIEQNGSISIIKKEESTMAHPIVIDGNTIEDNLNAQGFDNRWLQKRLTEAKVTQKEVFLMTINDAGEINIIIKEEKDEG